MLTAATAQIIAGDERSSEMSGDQAAQAIFFQRVSAAGIPRCQAQKRVQEAKRNGQNERFMLIDLVRNGEKIGQQPCNGNPCEQVNDDAAELAEDGMHNRALIFNDDAAHQAACPSRLSAFACRRRSGGRLLIGFVNEPAKKADAFHGDPPLSGTLISPPPMKDMASMVASSPSMSAWRKSI